MGKAGKTARSSPKKRSLVMLSILCMLAGQPAIARGNRTAEMVLGQQGRILYQRGEYGQAAAYWTRAAAEFAARGDLLNQAMALSNLSLTYQQLGKWEEAQRAIAQSMEILQGHSKSPTQQRMEAQTLDIQGQQRLVTGKTADALLSWEKAAELYELLEDKSSLIRNQINQGQAMKEMGFYPRACQKIKEALALSSKGCALSESEIESIKSQEVSPVQVLGMNTLADILRLVGDSDDSRAVLTASLQLAKKYGNAQILSQVYLGLGNTVRAKALEQGLDRVKRQELRNEAIIYYQEAAAVGGDPLGGIQAQVNEVSMLVESDEELEAVSKWQRLRGKIISLAPSKRAVYSQLNLGKSLLEMRGKQKLAKELQPTADQIDEIFAKAGAGALKLQDDRTYAYALGLRGKLYEQNQQWSQAKDFTKAALSKVSSFTAADVSYQLLWQLGRLEKAEGNKKSAIVAYTKAVDTLQSLRSDLVTVNPEIQFSFKESVEPVYRELVELLLQPGSTQENIQQARELIEALQLAELDNFFREACLKAKPLEIDQVDPKAAVIYPIILPDRLEVIVSLPGQPLRKYRTEVSQAEAERVVKQMRGSLNPLFSSKQRLRLSQKLYDWLIGPAAEDLAASEVESLVFVLDGVLRNLPMAALYDGQQYLLEKYKIALTPGLQLLESRGLEGQELQALTMGLSAARQGFDALPAVEFEMNKIQAEVPGTQLLNQQFTRPNLQAQMQEVPFPIIHLATHGQFSSQAEDTFLLTWDGVINVKQLDKLLRTREQEPSPIELLVLSACETASGDERAVLGLAGVAVRSGARSTIATLWQVNDTSTALLMAELYRQLAEPGVTKAEALRRAQLKILQQRKYKDPYYWAPFVLVGNWL